MSQTENRSVVRVFLSVLISFLLYLTGFGSLFFTLPLLMLDRRYPKRTTDTACVAALVLVLGRNILLMRDVLDQGLTWAFIAVTMFMPLSLILSAMVWVGKGNGENTFRRVLLSFSPVLVLFILYEIALVALPQVRTSLVEAYGGTLAAMLTALLGLEGEAVAFMAEVLLFALCSLTLPIALANSVVLAFVYEAASHSGDSVFERRIRTFRVADWFIYVFLALWAMVLLFYLVAVPMWITIPVLGLAVCALFIYFMQGFAIVAYRLYERGSTMTSLKMAAWLFLILLVVQLLNAALVFGLSILGVLETWINFRKPKEFSDEDHS